MPQKSSFLGRAGVAGLEKAVEVLDTLGSSMSSLNPNSGFASGIASRGNKISILAFEVANTIAKGANLRQSLSEENIQFLKKEILHSEGVQQLVSTDLKELLSIAAADKRLLLLVRERIVYFALLYLLCLVQYKLIVAFFIFYHLACFFNYYFVYM